MKREAWLYYWRYYAREKKNLALAVIAGLLQAVLLFPIAFLVREAFQKAIPEKQPAQILWISALIFFLYICNGAMVLLARKLTLLSTKKAIGSLRLELLHKFQSLPQSFYATSDKGRLHAMVVQDTHQVDVMSNLIVTHLIPAFAVIAVLGAVLIYLNWVLFAVMWVVVPTGLLLTRPIGRRMRELVKEYQLAESRFSSAVLFFLETLDLARIHSAEQFQRETTAESIHQFRQMGSTASWWETAYVVRHEMIGVTAIVFILLGGGLSIVAGWMTVAEMLSFLVAATLLRGYVSTATRSIPRTMEGNEALSRLFDFLNLPDRLPYQGTTQITCSGDIKLEKVCFRYRDHPVLSDIDLFIQPGEIILLTGPNGSGKSTIVNLILGLYRPEIGNLYANGIRYEELDLISLRGSIGVVVQNPFWIPGTIQENIAYGCDEVNSDDLTDAAVQAHAHEFISRLPQGYDTAIGEDGVLLSGGERQRIAIARAVYRRPSLLILDEPTNHLDSVSVALLLKNLQNLPQSPSILIVTHEPLSNIAFDRVYQLENGKIQLATPPQHVKENFVRLIN